MCLHLQAARVAAGVKCDGERFHAQRLPRCSRGLSVGDGSLPADVLHVRLIRDARAGLCRGARCLEGWRRGCAVAHFARVLLAGGGQVGGCCRDNCRLLGARIAVRFLGAAFGVLILRHLGSALLRLLGCSALPVGAYRSAFGRRVLVDLVLLCGVWSIVGGSWVVQLARLLAVLGVGRRALSECACRRNAEQRYRDEKGGECFLRCSNHG